MRDLEQENKKLRSLLNDVLAAYRSMDTTLTQQYHNVMRAEAWLAQHPVPQNSPEVK